MKRIIITTITILLSGALISWVLLSNKKENEEKAALVSQEGNIIPVAIATATKEAINLNFSTNGSFSADQDLQLQAETSGKITKLFVDKGDHVTKGQTLAIVESEVAVLEVNRAEENYQKLTTDFQRYQSSFQTGGVTQAQFDEIKNALENAKIQLKQAKKRVQDATIKSPISGVINDRSIEIGSFVAPGINLFEIVDAAYLKLNVTANEYQVVNIQKGDSVLITSKVFPDAKFEGVVSFIAEKADNSLSYPIEIKLKNQEKLPLKPGMYATAQFQFPEEEPRIVISRTAFVGSVHSNQIYVCEKGSQIAQLREVVAGRVLGDYVEIISGLEEGEAVITSGQINLSDGAKVEALK